MINQLLRPTSSALWPSRITLLVAIVMFCSTWQGANLEAAPPVEIIVSTSSGHLLEIDRNISVDNAGTVAFTGKGADGLNRVYVTTGPEVPPVPVSFAHPIREFRGTAINNTGSIAALDECGGPECGGNQYVIHEWPADGTLDYTIIGSSASGHFRSAASFVDNNDSGVIVFPAASSQSDVCLFGGTGSEAPSQIVCCAASNPVCLQQMPLFPSISNTNQIVIRDYTAGTNPRHRLFLYSYPHGTPSFIVSASPTTELLTIGPKPSIAPDGSVVAFAARSANGDRVYAAVRWANRWQLVPLVGAGINKLSSVDFDQRVGVTSFGSLSIGQQVTIVFSGATQSETGVFLAHVQLRGVRSEEGQETFVVPELLTMMPLVALGHEFSQGIVAEVDLYDPISQSGTVAAWVRFTNGSIGIARARIHPVPIEGGVREAFFVSHEIASRGRTVRIEGGTDDPRDVRLYSDDGLPPAIFFTPPARDPGPRKVQVELDDGSEVDVGFLGYTDDALASVIAIRDGVATYYEELLDFRLMSETEFGTTATKTGTIAEHLLAQVFDRKSSPKIAEAYSTLATTLEGFLPSLRDDINRRTGHWKSSKRALVYPVTDGQTHHAQFVNRTGTVLLTLATGTLALGDPSQPDSGQLDGGEFWFRLDTPRPIGTHQAPGWDFVVSDAPAAQGLEVSDLRAAAVCEQGASAPMQEVASSLRVSRLFVDWETAPDEAYLLAPLRRSHIYVNGNVIGSSDHDRQRHGLRQWILSAVYRLPLDEEPIDIPEDASVLTVRQSYGFTDSEAAVEPSECVCGRGAYPRVTFSVYGPAPSEFLPRIRSVDSDFRFDFTPQKGTGDPIDEYVAGLYKDVEESDWSANLPTLGCLPIPFHYDFFECRDEGGPIPDTFPAPVTATTIFDTRSGDPEFITPDNMHFHHRHPAVEVDAGLGIGGGPVSEAPFSADGTVHLHWRWGEQLGSGFGSGRSLLPEGQHWVMALVRSDFEASVDGDFLETIRVSPPQEIETAEKSLLIRTVQAGVVYGRQYETMTPGWAYAVGPNPNGLCPYLDDWLRGIGYWYIAQSKCGIPGADPSSRTQEEKRADCFATVQERLNWIGYIAGRAAALGEEVSPTLDSVVNRWRALGWPFVPQMGPCESSAEIHSNKSALPWRPFGAGAGSRYIVKSWSEEDVGLVTPFTVVTSRGSLTFESEPDAHAFVVGPMSDLALIPGAWLHDRSPTGGNSLSIRFDRALGGLHSVRIGLLDFLTTQGGELAFEYWEETQNRMVDAVNVVFGIEECLGATTGRAVAERFASRAGGAAWSNVNRFILRVKAPVRLAMRDLVATVEGVVIGFGDMNLDGSIDAIDLPFVLADLVGPASSTPVLIPEADMDGDDDVDLTDIAAFMNAFTGGD